MGPTVSAEWSRKRSWARPSLVVMTLSLPTTSTPILSRCSGDTGGNPVVVKLLADVTPIFVSWTANAGRATMVNAMAAPRTPVHSEGFLMSRASFVSGGDRYETSDFSIHPARSSSFRPRAAGVPRSKSQTSANAGYAEAPRVSADAPVSPAKAPLLMTAMPLPFRVRQAEYIANVFCSFEHMTKNGGFPRLLILSVVVFGDKIDCFCTYSLIAVVDRLFPKTPIPR